MAYYPIEGYNTFLLNCTLNQFHLEFLNPFSVGSLMSVTINYPVLDDVDDSQSEYDTPPSYTLKDFYVVGSAFQPFLEDEENSFLFKAFEMYRYLALNDILYGNVRDEVKWRYLVSLYIAHRLEIHIEDLKDDANRKSLNGEVTEKVYSVDRLSVYTKNEFYMTSYGIRFWNTYEPIGKWVFKGHRSQRGKY
jgi:hypothetical protein